MKKIDVKNIFHNLLKHKPTEYRTISSKAHHDWKMMLIMFFFLWIVIIAGSIYIFIKIDKGQIFLVTSNVVEKRVTVDKKLLDQILEQFEGRKVQLEKLKTERPNSIDPSI